MEKEHPLTTTAIYIQDRIGAEKRHGHLTFSKDVIAANIAIKIAHDMMYADPEIETVLIAGGSSNGDFIDFTDASVSFMFNRVLA